jgi:hypothetical protein
MSGCALIATSSPVSASTLLSTALALALTGVFVVAGIAKLMTRNATVNAFRTLGLPSMLATAVPIAELGIAALLLTVPRIGALAAVALLGAFTAFLISKVRSGETVRCACFGSGASDEVTSSTILRNAIMIASALCIAVIGASFSRSQMMPIAAIAGLIALISALIITLWDLRRITGGVFGARPQLGSHLGSHLGPPIGSAP